MNAVRLQALHRAPPSSRLCQLWSRTEDLQRVWNRDKTAVWDQVGLSHYWHDGLVMVRDKARLRRGDNDQSSQGHQCSETTLTGESRFHISTPLGIEPGSLMTGSKQGDHWTSGTVYECSEIVGSPQIYNGWLKSVRIFDLSLIEKGVGHFNPEEAYSEPAARLFMSPVSCSKGPFLISDYLYLTHRYLVCVVYLTMV
jgi:hypothetical protein